MDHLKKYLVAWYRAAGQCWTTHTVMDRLIAVAFVILLIACQVPLWIGEYVPGHDIGNHAGMVSVIRHYDDPSFNFKPYFNVDAELSPYTLFYYSCAVMARFVSVENAIRIFMAATVLLLPLAMLYALRSFGRPRALSLLVFPFVWEHHAIFGYVAFRASLVLLLFLVAAVRRELDQPRLRCSILVGLLGIVAFFCHAHGFVMLGCALTVLLLLDFRSLKRTLRAALPLAPAALLGCYWLLSRFSANPYGGPTAKPSFEFMPPLGLLQILPTRVLNILRADTDEWVLLVWGLTVIGLVLWPDPGGPVEPHSGHEPPQRRLAVPAVITLIFIALYLLFPLEIRTASDRMFGLSYRFIAPIFLFTILAIPRPRLSGWKTLVLIPVVLATAAYFWAITAATVRFQERFSGLSQAIALMQPGKRVITFFCRPDDPDFSWTSYAYAAGYYLARKGGVINDRATFAIYNYMPVSLKPAGRLPSPAAQHFRYDKDGRFYDYFLIIDEPPFRCDPFVRQQATVRQLMTKGKWRLYENVFK